MPLKAYNFVFDLDDTLFKERDYVASALRFAGGRIQQMYGINDPSAALIAAFAQGHQDPIGALWAAKGLPPRAKSGVISAMRAHIPDIALSPATKAFIQDIRAKGAGFAILTDGRSLTQRAKIAALGLMDADMICISEETGAEKPSEKGFKAIEAQAQTRRHIYIGDNPRKDFLAPNARGWLTFMLKDNGQNIPRAAFVPPPKAMAQIAIDHPAEILAHLMQKRR